MHSTTRTSIPRGMAIRVLNEGGEIVATDYWESPLAAHGALYCSVRADTVRLLLPAMLEDVLTEMRTGSEVLVTRGPWPELGRRDALELLWEDGSTAPFAVHLSAPQFEGLDALEGAPHPLVCHVYTRGEHGTAVRAGTWPARFRHADALPFLRPWEESGTAVLTATVRPET